MSEDERNAPSYRTGKRDCHGSGTALLIVHGNFRSTESALLCGGEKSLRLIFALRIPVPEFKTNLSYHPVPKQEQRPAPECKNYFLQKKWIPAFAGMTTGQNIYHLSNEL